MTAFSLADVYTKRFKMLIGSKYFFRMFYTDCFLQRVRINCTAQDIVIFHPFVSSRMLNKNL